MHISAQPDDYPDASGFTLKISQNMDLVEYVRMSLSYILYDIMYLTQFSQIKLRG